MTPKSDFLLIGAGTIIPKGCMSTTNFGKTSLFVEQDYEQQINTRLWSVRVNKWFKKRFFWDTFTFGTHSQLMKFRKLIEIFHCCMTSLRDTNLSVFIQFQYTRTILWNKNMGQGLFKKHSKFQNFDEIFYCGMTRLRSTSLGAFIQCQYTRTIFRNKHLG